MASPQALSLADRRWLAGWAADCAEHVLDVFAAEVPEDPRPRELVERARLFAHGELDAAAEIRRRFHGGVGRGEVTTPAAAAAARAAGQAVAVCHMGAHALGAAAYAAVATGLAHPERPEARDEEIGWQLARLTPDARRALRSLPAAGADRSGPLGPGLLTTGAVGAAVWELQTRLLG